jgi:hypothetical protein
VPGEVGLKKTSRNWSLFSAVNYTTAMSQFTAKKTIKNNPPNNIRTSGMTISAEHVHVDEVFGLGGAGKGLSHNTESQQGAFS